MYNYEIKKSDNYEVILKENEFYENQILASGLYYPGKSVDEYKINYLYDFKANEKKIIEYSYNITGELVGTVLSNDGIERKVWTRNFELLENKTGKVEGKNFSINEVINIDYEYYNNLARKYEEAYLLPIDSVLKVKLNVSFKNLDNKKFEDYIETDINITDDVTSLTENYEKIETNLPKSENQNISQGRFLGITFIIFLIIIIFFINKKIKEKMTYKRKYKIKVKKILNSYKDLIVIVKNKPNFDGMKILETSDLEGLINVSEQTKNNIIYYEEIKNMKSKLYIVVDNYVYSYEIKV